jgi:hypothetical protein
VELTDTKRYKENKWHAVILSIDLGKARDHSAWVACEVKPEVRTGTRDQRIIVTTLTVRDIVRLPLGTPYDEIEHLIHEEFWSPEWWLLDEKTEIPVPPQLLIDAGGPGDATVDTLGANLGLRSNIISYKLTRGSAEVKYHSKSRFTCPRTVLFQRLYASFSNDQIGIDPRLELGDVLAQELKNLKVEANEETGYERVVHREGEHDDVAIAVGAANFLANIQRGRRRVRFIHDEETIMRLMGWTEESIREARRQRSEPKPHTPIRMPGGGRMGGWR